jgi:SOS response regulatory protein OraA/RecX
VHSVIYYALVKAAQVLSARKHSAQHLLTYLSLHQCAAN